MFASQLPYHRHVFVGSAVARTTCAAGLLITSLVFPMTCMFAGQRCFNQLLPLNRSHVKFIKANQRKCPFVEASDCFGFVDVLIIT